jgi:hypothetical protein
VASTHANATASLANHTLPASAKPQDTRTKRRSANYVRTQAASPQVISSLIDQLSAISVPAHDHFENLLVGYNDGSSTPASASVYTVSGRNSLAGHDGTSVDQAAYYNSIREQNDAYPDDACEPPVIRTSKPPSGLSALTAPKKRDKPHSLSSYIGRNSGSSVSLHSTHSNHSASSIGNISIEVGHSNRPSGSSERSSAESKRNTKGHRSLMYMSSRERLRLNSTERKRHTTQGFEDIPSLDSPRVVVAPLYPYEDTIKEEPTSRDEDRPFGGEPSRLAQQFTDRNRSPRRIRLNLVDGPNGASPTEKGLIPERGSSLRHTGSPSRKSRKNRHSRSSSGQGQGQGQDTVAEEAAGMDTKPTVKEKILQELEHEENDVAQRIRQLKEQKLRRDILAGKQPVDADADAGAAPPTLPHVSVIPSPEPSPTSTVSSTSDRPRRDCTKAHRVLGISTGVLTAEKLAEALPKKDEVRKIEPDPMEISPTRNLRHTRHRSLTVNDGDDLTPLPIDYALALQRLEEASPQFSTLDPSSAKPYPAPSISVSSSKGSKSSITLPQHATSSAVGGRSAIGRKATTSVMTGTTKGHKPSSSVTDSAVSLKPPSFRSTSEEIVPRHQSMLVSLPASNSLQLQRRRTLTKKRWSHPDLPAKAEKEHNEKVERLEAAITGAPVQQLPYSVVEERPISLDSIDLEVNSYLNSPRLSQKIRHPQTGRLISFSEVGDSNGYAVFVCVGMGLTRYVMAFYDQLAATLNLRLITPDRPGIGGSQADPNGTPLSWPGKRFIELTCRIPTDYDRRRSCDMSSTQDYQILVIGAFSGRCLRPCNFIANAPAHPGTRSLARAMDTSITDGAYRHQSRFTSNTTTTSIATLSPRSSALASQSRKFYIS